MRNLKTAVVTLLLIVSLAAGCTGNNPEGDLDAKYQEGYDAGYGDAYDASYDGVAQHQYNEGWDDGWVVANTDSQAEIAEIQATVSGLEGAIALMEEQRDSLLAQLSDSQEFANQTLELADAMNETIAGITVCEGDSVEVNDSGYCVGIETINCFQAGFCDEAHSMGMGNGTSLCGDATLAECATEEQRADYWSGASAFQATGYHMPQWLHVSLVGNMCGSN